MADVWDWLRGTTTGIFGIGRDGPNLKDESGELAVRDNADAAYEAIRALLFKTYGDDFELNAGAAGSGSDWKLTLSRPSTGMTHDLQVIFPSADPAPGQALTVASLVGDVITLQWTTIAAGTDKIVVDTTSLAFGSSSPVAMFALPANAVVREVRCTIDTQFNGTPSASVGITGTTSKYMPATALDLTDVAGSVYKYTPAVVPSGSGESLIITYSAGSASAGAARFEVSYCIPS